MIATIRRLLDHQRTTPTHYNAMNGSLYVLPEASCLASFPPIPFPPVVFLVAFNANLGQVFLLRRYSRAALYARAWQNRRCSLPFRLFRSSFDSAVVDVTHPPLPSSLPRPPLAAVNPSTALHSSLGSLGSLSSPLSALCGARFGGAHNEYNQQPHRPRSFFLSILPPFCFLCDCLASRHSLSFFLLRLIFR